MEDWVKEAREKFLAEYSSAEMPTVEQACKDAKILPEDVAQWCKEDRVFAGEVDRAIEARARRVKMKWSDALPKVADSMTKAALAGKVSAAKMIFDHLGLGDAPDPARAGETEDFEAEMEEILKGARGGGSDPAEGT